MGDETQPGSNAGEGTVNVNVDASPAEAPAETPTETTEVKTDAAEVTVEAPSSEDNASE